MYVFVNVCVCVCAHALNTWHIHRYVCMYVWMYALCKCSDTCGHVYRHACLCCCTSMQKWIGTAMQQEQEVLFVILEGNLCCCYIERRSLFVVLSVQVQAAMKESMASSSSSSSSSTTFISEGAETWLLYVKFKAAAGDVSLPHPIPSHPIPPHPIPWAIVVTKRNQDCGSVTRPGIQAFYKLTNKKTVPPLSFLLLLSLS